MKTNITYISAVGVHAALGFIIYLNESIAKLYFLSALLYFLYGIIMVANKDKTLEVLKACAYFVGAEVFFRTTKASISYEAGKYIVIMFVLIGMFYKGVSGKGYPYFIYLMFLVPSVFVASTTLSFDANFRTNIAFVLSGPVCLGLAALFCYNKHVTFKQMSQILLFLLLPIIAHTVYIYFYAPDLKDIITGTGSNRSAAGGFGANQVATALGLGMFVLGIRVFINSPTIGIKLFNIAILILMSYRAIVTFSRGGVIAALLCIGIFLFMYFLQAKSKARNRILGIFVLFVGAMVLSWIISSNQSSGMLEKRYANQNARGVDKTDITTGRGELFMGELEGFITNPFFGIGSSRAKDQRIEEDGQGVTSHNEVSRTLAEHGIFGLIILIILLIKPLDLRSSNKQNYYFYALLAFWFATINHSSMRIAAPAFIYALALLNVKHEKRPIHRKQLKDQNV
ncbi:O-antigen ligase family protein [Winogradskyella bathintestinalis]|uniref:O-antigen ligase family protein n=1 Tax=Winogradskyella bathintestinalis TaxID=3035208 RepID=A0ABT7ZTS4_9FLAO|nr:O-antigen ligase family protein [Winogradskyella bathintestinalis]MDN3492407.1 O-antigen ligase family protein [Winogradskyella bathintestinalis]